MGVQCFCCSCGGRLWVQSRIFAGLLGQGVARLPGKTTKRGRTMRMTNPVRKASAGYVKGSFAYRCRKKRMQEFEVFYREKVLPQRSDEIVKILDIGGVLVFWKSMEFKYLDTAHVTLLNLTSEKLPADCTCFSSVAGSATDLSAYGDKAFDLTFSNSVIEHVGDFAAQQRMADEMVRTGKHCYLQTPNRFFIMEPHYLVPFFQFFPLRLRAFFIRRFQLGNTPQAKTWEEALQLANSIRLLTYRELQRLFPNAEIKKEKIGIFTKSFYLYF